MPSVIEIVNQQFDIPGLTGVWAYRQKGKFTMWSATVITHEGVFDTDTYTTPLEALNAAKAIAAEAVNEQEQ